MNELTDELVELGREQRLAGGHRLLGAAPSFQVARRNCGEAGVTFLKPGVLFGAIVVRAAVVHAALLLNDPAEWGPSLRAGFGGGPVFYGEQRFGTEGTYIALKPASVAAMQDVRRSVAHHHGALLEVPAPERVRPDEGPAWWVASLEGPAVLCASDPLADLIGLGHDALTGRLGGSRGA
ncbi:hypothetical protein [Streptomyces parvus]|uniref:hypothetical protein n=1 Tax=Streptomyces parvus TaxID=66428 RepID=UPI00371E4DDF